MKRAFVEQLQRYWRGTRVTVAAGASEAALSAASRRLGAALPAELVELLQHVDGFEPPHEQDPEGFRFHSSDEIRWWSDEERSLLVFCDYLVECWYYCVELGTGRVVMTGTESGVPQPIADSLADFADLYVKDATELYPSS